MTTEDQNKLKDNLLKEKKEIQDELKDIENPLVRGEAKVDDIGESMEDSAVELSKLDRDQAMVNELETRLKDIDSTLEKISSGQYGKCDNCSNEIEEPRLKAMPVAALCISCAQKFNK
jgi:DnaK suppressor protein